MVSGCKQYCHRSKHSLASISVSKKRFAHLIILRFYAINEMLVLDAFGGFHELSALQLPPDSNLDPELAQLGSVGFTGCLSSVLFNTASPLKAALLHPDTSSVTVSGPLSRSVCGSTAAGPSSAETTHHLSGQTVAL